jgi:hypothetical protein
MSTETKLEGYLTDEDGEDIANVLIGLSKQIVDLRERVETLERILNSTSQNGIETSPALQ